LICASAQKVPPVKKPPDVLLAAFAPSGCTLSQLGKGLVLRGEL